MWKGKQKAKINRSGSFCSANLAVLRARFRGEFGRPIFQKILRVETDTNNQVGLALA
jgi:hypothetical protein